MRFVWLDCDPGHDDATAILLAVHCENIRLLGVSTVHGNTDVSLTAKNAARCLIAFRAPPRIRVYPGVPKPLILPVRHDPEIHGEDGLKGAEGLPDADSAEVMALMATDSDGKPVRALEGMAQSIRTTWDNGAGHQVTVISTGPMTNIALFVSVYPDLLDGIEEFVFMGGAVGLGNRSPVAEFNILCDPHAAQIVLNAPVKKTMIPLNVSHQTILTKQIHARILGGGEVQSNGTLPSASSTLRHTLSTILAFFTETYKAVFDFNDGPPLHDALTLGYVSRPSLFSCKRHRVDVELTGQHSLGETVVDIWHYRSCDNSWGATGKNCLVADSIDVDGFFDLLLKCVGKCERSSCEMFSKSW